jgi:hypothetical protein
MTFRTCASCGGDLTGVAVEQKLFRQFLMKVVRCPQCRLRTTVLTLRKLVDTRKRRFTHTDSV